MERLIVSDPEIMMGKPVIAGTRITVELILEKMAAGETIDQILDAYPHLTREVILAALGFTAQSQRKEEGDLLPEYRFDYSKAKQNRFAELANAEPLTVPLDPDVAEVFTTAEAVNKALRAFIEAMPARVEEKTAD